MRILITGGSGELGRHVTPLLQAKGYTVRILSRSPRREGIDPQLEWAQGQIATGEGLANAMDEVDAIIHAASNAASPKKVDIDGTRQLIAAAKQADIQHLAYISIVGVDQHPMAYYQAKWQAEQLIEASGLPWTILRATQFHSLLAKYFLPALFKLPWAFVPTDFQFQLMDVSEAAAGLAAAVEAGPSGRMKDIGGPEILTFGEAADLWLAATGQTRRYRHIHLPGKWAKAFREGVNTTPNNRDGKIVFQAWLDKNYPPTPTTTQAGKALGNES